MTKFNLHKEKKFSLDVDDGETISIFSTLKHMNRWSGSGGGI